MTGGGAPSLSCRRTALAGRAGLGPGGAWRTRVQGRGAGRRGARRRAAGCPAAPRPLLTSTRTAAAVRGRRPPPDSVGRRGPRYRLDVRGGAASRRSPASSPPAGLAVAGFDGFSIHLNGAPAHEVADQIRRVDPTWRDRGSRMTSQGLEVRPLPARARSGERPVLQDRRPGVGERVRIARAPPRVGPRGLGDGVNAESIMTDKGPAYRSRDFAAVIAARGLRHIHTRSDTPRTNGKAQRDLSARLRTGLITELSSRRPQYGTSNLQRPLLDPPPSHVDPGLPAARWSCTHMARIGIGDDQRVGVVKTSPVADARTSRSWRPEVLTFRRHLVSRTVSKLAAVHPVLRWPACSGIRLAARPVCASAGSLEPEQRGCSKGEECGVNLQDHSVRGCM